MACNGASSAFVPTNTKNTRTIDADRVCFSVVAAPVPNPGGQNVLGSGPFKMTVTLWLDIRQADDLKGVKPSTVSSYQATIKKPPVFELVAAICHRHIALKSLRIPTM